MSSVFYLSKEAATKDGELIPELHKVILEDHKIDRAAWNISQRTISLVDPPVLLRETLSDYKATLSDLIPDATYHSCINMTHVFGEKIKLTIRIPTYRYDNDYDDVRFDVGKLVQYINIDTWKPDDNYWVVDAKVKIKESHKYGIMTDRHAIVNTTFNDNEDVYDLCGKDIQPFFEIGDRGYKVALSKNTYDEDDFIEYKIRKGLY